MSLWWRPEQWSAESFTQAFARSHERKKVNAAKTTHIAPLRRVFHPDRVVPLFSWLFFHNAIHPRKLIFLALLFVLFRFVVLAQHFPVRVHFNADLLPILLNDSFIIGAFFLPTND